MVTIGIDPAARKDGTALCIIDEQGEVSFQTFASPYRFILWAHSDEAPMRAIVGIEDSGKDKTVFAYLRTGSTASQRSKAVAVGKNMGASAILVECCQQVWGKGQVFDMSPTEKGAKIKDVSIFAAYVRSNKHRIVSGYKGINDEQDERDSYLVAIKAAKFAKFGRPRRATPKTQKR